MHVQAIMLAAIPATGGATPSLVVHTAGESADTTSVTTPAIDTTGATFLVAVVGMYHPTAGGAVTDSKGNTWTQVGRYGSGATVDVQLFACYSPVVGTGHFVTFTTAFGSYCSMEVMAFSGITASASNADTGTSTSSSTTAQPGSITPSVAHTLVITGLADDGNGGGAVSINGAYTLTDSVQGSGNFSSAAAYLVLSAAAAQNPTWNVTNTTANLTAAIAAFAY